MLHIFLMKIYDAQFLIMKLYLHIIHSIYTLLFLCAVVYVCACEGHRSNLGVSQVPSTVFLEKESSISLELAE